VLARERGRGSDVGEFPGGIGGRLHPQQARRCGSELALDVGDVGVVVEGKLDAAMLGEVQQPLAQRPVHRLRGEDAVPRLQCLQHGRCRGVAGGEQQGLGATVELAQHLFRLDVGGAGVARIDPPARVAAVCRALEGAGEVNGRDDVAVGLGHAAKAMHGEGFE